MTQSATPTDAEVISMFMEPDAPANGGRPGIDVLNKFSPKGWWRYSMLSCNWKQSILTAGPKLEKLGRLHEVEARLADDQWEHYWMLLDHLEVRKSPYLANHAKLFRIYAHLTAEQKIAALAEVIRQTGGAR